MYQPDLTRVPEYYHKYINLVPHEDLKELLEQHENNNYGFLKNIPEDKWDYRYAPGKWSIKELVQHLIDTERIFCYRALRFARKDKTELPGFDENAYAAASNSNKRTKEDLLKELQVIEQATTLLFKSFDEEQLEASGTANGKEIYVRAIGYIIIGHAMHHNKILSERYL